LRWLPGGLVGFEEVACTVLFGSTVGIMLHVCSLSIPACKAALAYGTCVQGCNTGIKTCIA
jgi:hypothetical protein